jgi:cell division septal protein FtsQ
MQEGAKEALKRILSGAVKEVATAPEPRPKRAVRYRVPAWAKALMITQFILLLILFWFIVLVLSATSNN